MVINLFPEWETRGIDNKNYVRIFPGETDGFFIAMFKRKIWFLIFYYYKNYVSLMQQLDFYGLESKDAVRMSWNNLPSTKV